MYEFCIYVMCFSKTCLCVNVFHMRNIPLHMTVMELRLMCSSHQQRRIFLKKWTNKVCTSNLNDGKNLCCAVCYWNQAGEDFDRDVIQHYIRNNLRVPSVTRAANSFHRESTENSVLHNKKKKKMLNLPVEIHSGLFPGCVYFTLAVTYLRTWTYGSFTSPLWFYSLGLVNSQNYSHIVPRLFAWPCT